MDPRVITFANAIAQAEGFFVPGTVPATHHNPGDLGPGDCPGYPAELHSGSYVCQLPDDNTGWNFLYQKIQRIFADQSSVYTTAMTITDFAKSYAGDWQDWSNNVATFLGISPNTKISDWLQQFGGGAPASTTPTDGGDGSPAPSDSGITGGDILATAAIGGLLLFGAARWLGLF